MSGQQVGVHQELVFLFGVFDEKESKNKPNNFTSDNHIKYTINGYTQGSLPGKSLAHTITIYNIIEFTQYLFN